MTRIVYADPNIPPDVWTPPRCVEVLPLQDHPAIIEDGQTEKLPPGAPRPRKIEAALIVYLRQYRQATVITICDDLGLNWRSVKSALLESPRVFRKVGEQRGKSGKIQTIWGLVDS